MVFILLTWPVEPLSLGDVVDLPVDGDADAALLARPVVLLQLHQSHVLLLQGRQRRGWRRQVGLCIKHLQLCITLNLFLRGAP